jgi:hypothetical protein
MRCFELLIAEPLVSNGGPFVPMNQLTYGMPEEAERLLEPILEPYGQHPFWFFDKLNDGRPPAPWALACLDREYELAGHVVTTRPANAGIRFAAYKPTPKQALHDFVPGVGVLVFHSKVGLERASNASPIFGSAWETLRECSEERRWLALLDPPNPEWLRGVLPIDRELWEARSC